MASTLVKIDIHLIFHVKSTGVKMRTEDLGRIFAYIGGIIKGIGGLPIEIGGMTDHVHILTSLPKTVSLADFVRAVKADSSKWMKQLAPCYAAFAWQEGYGAFSVSPSLIDKTVNCSWRHTALTTTSGMLSGIRKALKGRQDHRQAVECEARNPVKQTA